MPVCQACGASFTPTRSTQKNCSKTCRKTNAMRNYRATPKGAADTKKQNARPEAALRKKAWFEANPDYQAVYRKSYYTRVALEPSKRILEMQTHMTDHQRSRVADWLLKVNHPTLANWKVDEFVSDHNSEGI